MRSSRRTSGPPQDDNSGTSGPPQDDNSGTSGLLRMTIREPSVLLWMTIRGFRSSFGLHQVQTGIPVIFQLGLQLLEGLEPDLIPYL